MTSAKDAIVFGSLAVLAALLVYSARKLGSGLGSIADRVPDAINPASPNNIVYRAVSAPFGYFSPGDTLGTFAAGLFDSATRAAHDATLPTLDPYQVGGGSAWDDGHHRAYLAVRETERAMATGVDYGTNADVDDADLGAAMSGGLRSLLGFGTTPGGAATGMVYRR